MHRSRQKTDQADLRGNNTPTKPKKKKKKHNPNTPNKGVWGPLEGLGVPEKGKVGDPIKRISGETEVGSRGGVSAREAPTLLIKLKTLDSRRYRIRRERAVYGKGGAGKPWSVGKRKGLTSVLQEGCVGLMFASETNWKSPFDPYRGGTRKTNEKST